MNSNSLVNKQKKQKQKNNNNNNNKKNMKTEFQKSVLKFSFLCCVTDIKICLDKYLVSKFGSHTSHWSCFWKSQFFHT